MELKQAIKIVAALAGQSAGTADEEQQLAITMVAGLDVDELLREEEPEADVDFVTNPAPTAQQVAPLAPVKRKKKRASRVQRWGDAVARAKTAIGEIISGCDELEDAISELRGVQEEYEEWKDNLPENFQSSALGEKLAEVCNLEIDDAADPVRTAAEELEGKLDEAEGIDLPRGFGKD